MAEEDFSKESESLLPKASPETLTQALHGALPADKLDRFGACAKVSLFTLGVALFGWSAMSLLPIIYYGMAGAKKFVLEEHGGQHVQSGVEDGLGLPIGILTFIFTLGFVAQGTYDFVMGKIRDAEERKSAGYQSSWAGTILTYSLLLIPLGIISAMGSTLFFFNTCVALHWSYQLSLSLAFALGLVPAVINNMQQLITLYSEIKVDLALLLSTGNQFYLARNALFNLTDNDLNNIINTNYAGYVQDVNAKQLNAESALALMGALAQESKRTPRFYGYLLAKIVLLAICGYGCIGYLFAGKDTIHTMFKKEAPDAVNITYGVLLQALNALVLFTAGTISFIQPMCRQGSGASKGRALIGVLFGMFLSILNMLQTIKLSPNKTYAKTGAGLSDVTNALPVSAAIFRWMPDSCCGVNSSSTPAGQARMLLWNTCNKAIAKEGSLSATAKKSAGFFKISATKLGLSGSGNVLSGYEFSQQDEGHSTPTFTLHQE